jgi:hypothetical protein
MSGINPEVVMSKPLKGVQNGMDMAAEPMGYIIRRLQVLGNRISIENVRIDILRDRIIDEQGQTSWRKKKIALRIEKDASIEEVLETLVALDNSYDWYQYKDSDLYVVYPSTQRNPESNESEMMWEIEPLDVRDKPLKEILEEDFKISDHKISISMLRNYEMEIMERTFTISLPRMPFRDALNELLIREKDLYWGLGGLGGLGGSLFIGK